MVGFLYTLATLESMVCFVSTNNLYRIPPHPMISSTL